jgi:putative DNA primase/helicase
MSDPIGHALEQLLAAGLLVERTDFNTDGAIHRCDVEGEKRNKRSGWYIAKPFRLDDGTEVIVGSFGAWTGTQNNAQKLRFDGSKSSKAERDRLRDEMRELRARNAAHEVDLAREVAERAAGLWKGLPDLTRPTPYLERKRVSPIGLRGGRNGALVMPLRNTAGVIVQLQFIQADGTKRFLSGPGKKGGFHLVGEVADEYPLVFVEGLATGLSVHQATGWPVVVCVDAGNLLPVARALRVIYPSARYLFAGDDDHEKRDPKSGEPLNTGRVKGNAAAEAMGARVVFPTFVDPLGKSDFNDLHVHEGLDTVRAQLLQAYTPTPRADAGQDGPDEPWERELVFGDRGLKPMVHNTMLIAEHHPAWRGVLALDVFAQRVVMRREPPWGGKPGALTDADEIRAAAWFGRRDTYGINIKTGIAHEACVAVACRNTFHPVRDYLTSLTWDGETRLESFFPDFCHSKRDPAIEAFGRNFFISCVARVMDPGCKADLMLVLEGEQGLKKSTLARVLAGAEWYVDVGTSPADKDFYQLIQGKWLVEIAEMSAFVRAETTQIKRAVSVQVDYFRPPYGRNPEAFPRQCIFFGTSNDSDWQRDATGARRYMPVWVGGEIALDAIADLRDQLWAEAFVRYQRGDTWYELPEEAKEEQDARYLEDPWAEPVIRWLDGQAGASRYPEGNKRIIQETTAWQVLVFALDLDAKKHDRAAQTRIGNLMRRLGWKRAQVRSGGTRIWQYRRQPEGRMA